MISKKADHSVLRLLQISQQHFETQLERIKADRERFDTANMHLVATNSKYGNKLGNLLASTQQLDQNMNMNITPGQIGS